jgi:hypothetical protein
MNPPLQHQEDPGFADGAPFCCEKDCRANFMLQKGDTLKGYASEPFPPTSPLFVQCFYTISGFTPLEIMPRCSAVGLGFIIIPAGFNATLEFLTG